MKQTLSITVIAVLLAGCTALPGTGQPAAQARPTGPAWEILPVEVKLSPSDEGWQDVEVSLAFENVGSQAGPIPAQPHLWHISTGDGYTRTVAPALARGIPLAESGFPVGEFWTHNSRPVSDWRCILPPGIRIRGIQYQHCDTCEIFPLARFTCQVPSGARDLQLVLGSESIPLEEGEQALAYPADQDLSGWGVPGDTISFDQSGELTIGEVEHVEDESILIDWAWTMVDVTWKNLLPDSESTAPMMFSLVGSDGFWVTEGRGTNGSPCWDLTVGQLSAGPLEETSATLCFDHPLDLTSPRLLIYEHDHESKAYGSQSAVIKLD
jgi:hypothetical protein